MPELWHPLFTIEIMNVTCKLLVDQKRAECVHDGSVKFIPFKGSVPTNSKRFMIAYDIFTTPGNWLTAQRANIKLFFDYTENKGRYTISSYDKAQLDKVGLGIITQTINEVPTPNLKGNTYGKEAEVSNS